MTIERIKEEAIALGWVDVFENEGKLWGYASDRDVIPQMYPKQPRLSSTFFPDETIAGYERGALRRFRDRGRPPCLPDLRAGKVNKLSYLPPQPAWLEIQLTNSEGGGQRSLRFENVHCISQSIDGMGLVAYFVEFTCDREIFSELHSSSKLLPDKNIIFCSGQALPAEYKINGSCARFNGIRLKVELEIEVC